MTTPLIILLYGILVAAGGVYGYLKAQSTPSLIAGLGSGLLLVGAAVAMMRGAYTIGWWLALIVAVLLLLRFGGTAFSNFKFMPGGLMIVLSIIAIAALLLGRTQPIR